MIYLDTGVYLCVSKLFTNIIIMHANKITTLYVVPKIFVRRLVIRVFR